MNELKLILIKLITVTLTFNFAYGHSHIECVKKELNTLNCIGFPRYYFFNALNIPLPSSTSNMTFYASRDRFWHPDSNFGLCPPKLTSDMYNNNYPMASAFPGEIITTQHPPRGHSSQPNSNVEIYIHKSSGLVEQPLLQNMKLISSFPFSQNCVGLKQEISWANCTGSFTIPTNLSPGIYTFFWRWNLTSIPYGDCFDIEVKNKNSPTIISSSILPQSTCLCT